MRNDERPERGPGGPDDGADEPLLEPGIEGAIPLGNGPGEWPGPAESKPEIQGSVTGRLPRPGDGPQVQSSGSPGGLFDLFGRLAHGKAWDDEREQVRAMAERKRKRERFDDRVRKVIQLTAVLISLGVALGVVGGGLWLLDLGLDQF